MKYALAIAAAAMLSGAALGADSGPPLFMVQGVDAMYIPRITEVCDPVKHVVCNARGYSITTVMPPQAIIDPSEVCVDYLPCYFITPPLPQISRQAPPAVIDDLMIIGEGKPVVEIFRLGDGGCLRGPLEFFSANGASLFKLEAGSYFGGRDCGPEKAK